ncbi:MAG: ABC transporter permease subunit [Bdellovibrionales bacterium]|nr:ABC transporter permease subunit [Bdellovibrionales bacterium]
MILSKASFAKDRPKEWASIQELGNSIDESQMQMLNAKAEIDKESFSSIASSYLDRSSKVDSSFSSGVRGLIKNTKEHLFLVIVSLGIAIIVGVPLGIFADRHRLFGQLIMIVVGLFQTIPSLALLCFLIPLFGIGTLPALIALFLYALLPIVLSTYEALRSVSQSYRDSAKTLGLTFMRRLYLIYLPMTSSQILMGIKTSTIICIGTATLAALIGAGGYGVPIVTGLALNDSKLVLMGAIPAAAMALMTHLIFEAIKLILVPKGMRLRKTNV